MCDSVGRLLSVNVGVPRDIEWEGRTVHTGIWKQSVEGRRRVGRLNVVGDGQGDLQGHGGVNRAVFVYQIESYRYWQQFLARDDFTYGQFGENFTVEGLADDGVCIGDRLRIGSALLEVSQPRVTCYRVGIRMREPQMPSLLVAHRRPGFYLRVLEEGEVEAGDSVERVQRGAEAMTVAEIDGLLYLPNRARRDLTRALRIPALSEGWRGSFRDLLEQTPEGGAVPLAWAGLRRMRVVAIDHETATVLSVRLAPDDGKPAAPALPGQFLTVRLRPDPEATPLLRTYSLSDLPNAESYRISVKREPHGAASGYLHTRLQVGDVIEAGAPRGSFVLRPGERPVVLASAGVGATPVLAMLHVLACEHSARTVWWLHGARNAAEHAFRQEADRLLDQSSAPFPIGELVAIPGLRCFQPEFRAQNAHAESEMKYTLILSAAALSLLLPAAAYSQQEQEKDRPQQEERQKAEPENHQQTSDAARRKEAARRKTETGAGRGEAGAAPGKSAAGASCE